MAADRGSELSEGLGPNAEDDECSAPPRVTDPPDDLWLVYGDLEHDDTHANCCASGEVTWCEDAQFPSDVRYLRADLLYHEARQMAAKALEDIANEPPVNGSELAQARVLLAAAQLRGA